MDYTADLKQMIDLNGAPAPGVKLLLTAREAAAALSICARTLWELTDRGEILAVRIPGRGKARSIRYDIDDLRAWIRRLKQSTLAGLKDESARV
jgi:excisionase family DNA binding protein